MRPEQAEPLHRAATRGKEEWRGPAHRRGGEVPRAREKEGGEGSEEGRVSELHGHRRRCAPPPHGPAPLEKVVRVGHAKELSRSGGSSASSVPVPQQVSSRQRGRREEAEALTSRGHLPPARRCLGARVRAEGGDVALTRGVQRTARGIDIPAPRSRGSMHPRNTTSSKTGPTKRFRKSVYAVFCEAIAKRACVMSAP